MSKKILIIEDDEVMRKLLAEYLEQEKYLVKIAENGKNFETKVNESRQKQSIMLE